MSNTPDMSNWVRGPGRFYYINDLKNLGYLEHGNLEYSGYLEVFFSPKYTFYLVYVELRLIFRSAEHDLLSSSLIDKTLIDIQLGYVYIYSGACNCSKLILRKHIHSPRKLQSKNLVKQFNK